MRILRIGTRNSPLALWQAQTVQNLLKQKGYQSEIVAVRAEGDLELKKPLYEMGITGVFTKVLDIALLDKKIDLAVHSLKDVPTALPQGIQYATFLERGAYEDVLVYKKSNIKNIESLDASLTIATSSLRRKANWLHKYPTHQIENLRGNINLRIEKLYKNDWDGAIFALAGLERIDLFQLLENHDLTIKKLDWMISAPAQGIVCAVCSIENHEVYNALQEINNPESEICAHIERSYLRTLEGGCTAPIGAKARIEKNKIILQTSIASPSGEIVLRNDYQTDLIQKDTFGVWAAMQSLQHGAAEILQKIRKNT